MKVLVTGGAGFIGSHACKALARAGHTPVVFDNLSTGHREAVRWGPIEVGDVRDDNRLDKAFAAHRPELVMHFAALAYVGESMRSPGKYYDTNVGGSLSVVEAMTRHRVPAIVFSSSCATYGIPAQLPITERTPQRPISPYGYTKLMAERLLIDMERAAGLRWVALRYFNAAGADPDGDLGEDHRPETHAIPLAIQAALGQAPPFPVMGADYDTPDGSAIRDYVHVSDLADAHVKAAEYLIGGGRSIALNLATGQGVSVLEVVRAASRATGQETPVVMAPRREGDPPALYASADLAGAVLGWKPSYREIDKIVATAARWFMSKGLG